MNDMLSKVTQLLSDPKSAETIQQIAASMAADPPAEPPDAAPLSSAETFSAAQKPSAHSRDVALLMALRPYLRSDRAGKIDAALRAIRIYETLRTLR